MEADLIRKRVAGPAGDGDKLGTVKARSAAVWRKAGVSGRIEPLSPCIDELVSAPLAERAV